MKKGLDLFRFSFLAACVVFSACQPKAPQPESLIQTPALSSSESTSPTPGETPNPETPVSHGKLLISDDFEASGSLCLAEPVTKPFSTNCSENALTILQADGRRKVDILMMRELPVELGSFSLEVETLSVSSEKSKSDQNNYGLYFEDESGQIQAVRLISQYFRFETWLKDGEVKVEEKTNLAFSPSIKSAGQSNILRLDCSAIGCDFFANGSLAGRVLIGISSKTKNVGLFAGSNWDQQFGKVEFKNLRVFKLDGGLENAQPISIRDPLTSGSEVFAGTGLSGAFNKYEADGFHFSPVIPYGYYGVKGGPGLGDMTVGVTIRMEISPGVSGSRYAGLTCRSSLEGMVMAVIRVDGTYSIYRDTPRQPFALLAQKASNMILTGYAENKLRLDCVGDQIEFYINGAKVESFTDKRYGLRFGRAGLFTKAGGISEPDAVVFSDFSITEIR
jgi:hypothetical protein